MTSEDLFILMLMGLALAVVFYYRKTLGDVGTVTAAGVAGVAAASAILLRNRKEDRTDILLKASIKQTEVQVDKAAKKLEKLQKKKGEINAKYDAKDSGNPDRPDPDVVDFLKKRKR